MRMHLNHPLALDVRVTLDGEPVEAFFADEEAGVVLVTDPAYPHADPRTHSWAWRARVGKVEIHRQPGFAERAAELEYDLDGVPLP